MKEILQAIPLGTAAQWGTLAVMFVALLRISPAMNRIRMESDEAMRADLMKALKRERAHTVDMIEQERGHCDQRIGELTDMFTGQIEHLRAELSDARRDLVLALARGAPSAGPPPGEG